MQRVVIALLAFFLLQASCVSEKKYMALEADYTVQQAQTQARDRKIEAVEASLQKAEAENRRYTAEIATLQEQLQKSAERNRKLTEHLTTAEQELQKKASIIQLQEQVIRRTDATRRQIESELQEQIEKQEIKLEEMQGRLKVTFIDKILFNTGSAVINSRGRAVLRKVAASLGKHSGQTILVEGHTDNVAIGPVLREKFPHQLGTQHGPRHGRGPLPAG